MRGQEVVAVYEIDLDENRMKASVMGHASEQSLDVLVGVAKEAYQDIGLRLEERVRIFGEKVREFSHAVELSIRPCEPPCGLVCRFPGRG